MKKKEIEITIYRPFKVQAELEGHELTGLNAIFGPNQTDAFFFNDTLYVLTGTEIPPQTAWDKLPILQISEEEKSFQELLEVLTVDGLSYIARANRKPGIENQTTTALQNTIQNLQRQIDDLEQTHKQEILHLKAEQQEILQQMTQQCEIVNQQLHETEEELMGIDRERESLLLQANNQLEKYKEKFKEIANLPEVELSKEDERPQVPVEEMVREIATLRQQNKKLQQEAETSTKKSRQKIEVLQTQLAELKAKLDILRQEKELLQNPVDINQAPCPPATNSIENQENQELDYEVVPPKPEVPDEKQLLTSAFHHVLVELTLHFKNEKKGGEKTIPMIIDNILQEIDSILHGSHSLILDYPFNQEAEVVIDYFKWRMEIPKNSDFSHHAKAFMDYLKIFLAQFLRDLLTKNGQQRVDLIRNLKDSYQQYLVQSRV